MEKRCRKYNISFLTVFYVLSLWAVGLFSEYLSSFAAAVLCGYLLWRGVRKKSLRLAWNLTTGAALAIVVCYGLSVFWAVDSGAAFWGFLKYLTAGLYLLALLQEENGRDRIYRATVFAAAVMTVVSAVLTRVPVLTDYFSVGGRLAGFFQYPNTFAMLLLAALVLVGTKTALTWRDYVLLAVFVGGILLSGSRTVFALLVAAVAALLWRRGKKKGRIILGGAFALVVIAVAVYAVVTGNNEGVGRFVRLSLSESTFVGRLLYFRDAAGVILRHPFGLGYLGYYYLQPSFQTGVYSVRYIHNDFLQFMLDAGWVPAALLIAAMVKSFARKGEDSLRRRLLIILFAAHGCFDFDMQFVAMMFLLLTVLDYDLGKTKTVKIRTGALCAWGGAGAVCLYMGLAQALYAVGLTGPSKTMYPWNTQADIDLLTAAEDVTEMETIADRVLARNEHVPVAYSAKASAAYSRGDFAGVMEYKDKVLEEAPFFYEEYESYCYMLLYGVQAYEAQGDAASAQTCREKLLWVSRKLESVEDRLSPLGRKIDDQPTTELPEDIQAYIEAIGG